MCPYPLLVFDQPLGSETSIDIETFIRSTLWSLSLVRSIPVKALSLGLGLGAKVQMIFSGTGMAENDSTFTAGPSLPAMNGMNQLWILRYESYLYIYI